MVKLSSFSHSLFLAQIEEEERLCDLVFVGNVCCGISDRSDDNGVGKRRRGNKINMERKREGIEVAKEFSRRITLREREKGFE